MFTEVLSITYGKKKNFQQPGISEINYEISCRNFKYFQKYLMWKHFHSIISEKKEIQTAYTTWSQF